MVGGREDCSAGSATVTTVPSMKTMLEPRMAAANTNEGFVQEPSGAPTRIAASSHGGLTLFMTGAPPRSHSYVAGLNAFSNRLPRAHVRRPQLYRHTT